MSLQTRQNSKSIENCSCRPARASIGRRNHDPGRAPTPKKGSSAVTLGVIQEIEGFSYQVKVPVLIHRNCFENAQVERSKRRDSEAVSTEPERPGRERITFRAVSICPG
jgi:hypothetical protein